MEKKEDQSPCLIKTLGIHSSSTLEISHSGKKKKDLKKTSETAKLIGPDSKEMKAYGNRKMQLDLGTPRN